VTLDDPASADGLVAAARRERHDLPLGASDAVPETIEASFQVSEAVLVDVGVPMGTVIASIHKQREALQDAIGQWYPK
jgi:CPA2 family monovalent cation:H+ antiporter-2